MRTQSSSRRSLIALMALGLAAGWAGVASAQPQEGVAALQDVEGVELYRLQSALLTEFWGRPMFIEAGVVLPPESSAHSDRGVPICFSIHGFGGSHRTAWRSGPRLRQEMSTGESPRMIYVFLNAMFSLGHHEFADSVNNGPWGRALTEEFIPALEARYRDSHGAAARAEGRFLTGHSSGGWSSLWLQIAYPAFFGGTWSTAPDPVDFRDFTGVDIYAFDNAYVDPAGNTIPLVRRGRDWSMTLKQYAQDEYSKRDYGGQFGSFDAVFSPRAEDGRPQKLFDRDTGVIDRAVADAWKKYDIRLKLRREWPQLGPRLTGKLRIYVGTLDTYRLEGAVRLLQEELVSLGSDAEVVIVEGRNHGDLLAPHDDLWPQGLLRLIHHQMWAQWEAAAGAPMP